MGKEKELDIATSELFGQAIKTGDSTKLGPLIEKFGPNVVITQQPMAGVPHTADDLKQSPLDLAVTTFNNKRSKDTLAAAQMLLAAGADPFWGTTQPPFQKAFSQDMRRHTISTQSSMVTQLQESMIQSAIRHRGTLRAENGQAINSH